MREPSAEPVAEDGTAEPARRSQRPPRPLTHRMDLNAVRAAFFQSGLMQPELEQKRPRSNGAITKPRQPPSAIQPLRDTENSAMQATEETTTSTKPGVGGTQQTHTAKVIGTVSEGQKCLMYGATVVTSGTVLMLVWKGLGRWLG